MKKKKRIDKKFTDRLYDLFEEYGLLFNKDLFSIFVQDNVIDIIYKGDERYKEVYEWYNKNIR